MSVEDFLSKLPPHKCELSLTHNQHLSCYETVEEMCTGGYPGDEDWVSPEQRAKAFATNEIWILHWYPETPVGFCLRLACDLNALFSEPF